MIFQSKKLNMLKIEITRKKGVVWKLNMTNKWELKKLMSIKRKQSEETACGRQIRLQKVNESLKRKFSQEIVSEREIRLRKDSMSKKKKRSEKTASETKNRLQNNNVYKKTKQSKETVSEKQSRLQKDSAYRKKKRLAVTDNERGIRLEKDRLHKKQKRAKRVLQPQQEINQQDYLNMFDKINNGGIEEQCWAKANIIKFHKSVQYNVSQCTVCWEAWPLKSKPWSPYVCSRCSRDKQTPKKFSVENSMIPSSVPPELQNLTQIEEMLIARALPTVLLRNNLTLRSRSICVPNASVTRSERVPFAFQTRSICVPNGFHLRSERVPKCVPKRSRKNLGTRSPLWWNIAMSHREISTPNEIWVAAVFELIKDTNSRISKSVISNLALSRTESRFPKKTVTIC